MRAIKRAAWFRSDPATRYIDEAQLAWLRGELARVRPETPIVLVTHVPLLTSFFQATAGHEDAAPRNRVVVNHREVLDCFAKHRLHLPQWANGRRLRRGRRWW